MSVPTIVITPQAASRAYADTDRSDTVLLGDGPDSFGATLQRALGGAVDAGHAADAKAMQAIAGGGADITDVVTAVSKAELALQTTAAIRDRFVQAYQDIMKMPI